MVRTERTRWARLAATFTFLAALLPSLHGAASHEPLAFPPGAVIEGAADTGRHDASSETCPLCLAAGGGLPAISAGASLVAPEPETGPHATPAQRAVGRALTGPASPRAPPSA